MVIPVLKELFLFFCKIVRWAVGRVLGPVLSKAPSFAGYFGNKTVRDFMQRRAADWPTPQQSCRWELTIGKWKFKLSFLCTTAVSTLTDDKNSGMSFPPMRWLTIDKQRSRDKKRQVPKELAVTQGTETDTDTDGWERKNREGQAGKAWYQD